MTEEESEQHTFEMTKKCADLACEVRDTIFKQKGIQTIVAGSIGDYGIYVSGGATYNSHHAFTTPDEEFIKFHKTRFETFADNTDVDFITFET